MPEQRSSCGTTPPLVQASRRRATPDADLINLALMFLVLLRHSGPEWDLAQPMDQQSKWREHADYMDELVDAGVIILGGPLDAVRVVLAIEADSEETIRDILARDPWSETHLVVDTVDAWSLRLDGRKARR